MSDRPTDHLQPTSKRRPGEQLTKDNFDDDDDDGPVRMGRWGARAARARGLGAPPGLAPPTAPGRLDRPLDPVTASWGRRRWGRDQQYRAVSPWRDGASPGQCGAGDACSAAQGPRWRQHLARWGRAARPACRCVAAPRAAGAAPPSEQPAWQPADIPPSPARSRALQGHDPGQWGPNSKADEATLAKRKIVRARRGPAGAAPSAPAVAAPAAAAAAAAAPAADAPAAAAAAAPVADAGGDAAPANPFAGRSLVAAAAVAPAPAAANPLAGVSLAAASEVRGCASRGGMRRACSAAATCVPSGSWGGRRAGAAPRQPAGHPRPAAVGGGWCGLPPLVSDPPHAAPPLLQAEPAPKASDEPAAAASGKGDEGGDKKAAEADKPVGGVGGCP
jgi:hypothetical protein